MELFFSILASLFSVVNPLGALPVYLSMTPNYTQAERNRTARNASLYFAIILLTFFLAGSLILSFFGISLSAMRIAGGMMILSSAYSLLVGKQAENRTVNKEVEAEAMEKSDISFAPLAMPLLSGPGSISLLIGIYAEYPNWQEKAIIVGVILATSILVFLILRSAPYIYKVLGVAGLNAMSRIMGFIVMTIAVQYIIGGIVDLVKGLS
ncbi:MAG TPA: MarC family NAAT transporter [Saprospiraceae bacterium]|nr:MarC family NAAT transporter [Saprospiraceae bacterium]HMQ85567.1 MarC family NAAT transporter [Saprospiraceae bacterium]